jgi:hypothetical protein
MEDAMNPTALAFHNAALALRCLIEAWRHAEEVARIERERTAFWNHPEAK